MTTTRTITRTTTPTPAGPNAAPPDGPEHHRTHAPRNARRSADVLAWFFVGAGIMRLLPVSFDVALFASWGLPGWFRTAVGVAELAVGLLALRDGTRPIGLIGIGVVMVSAGTVHAALGHSLLVAVLVNGSLAATAFATAWSLRSEIR